MITDKTIQVFEKIKAAEENRMDLYLDDAEIYLLNEFISKSYTSASPGKEIKEESVEVKTTAQLIDELCIINIRVWMLIDKVEAGTATLAEAQAVQKHNATRTQLVRAINKRLGERDIGEKTYKG